MKLLNLFYPDKKNGKTNQKNDRCKSFVFGSFVADIFFRDQNLAKCKNSTCLLLRINNLKKQLLTLCGKRLTKRFLCTIKI